MGLLRVSRGIPVDRRPSTYASTHIYAWLRDHTEGHADNPWKAVGTHKAFKGPSGTRQHPVWGFTPPNPRRSRSTPQIDSWGHPSHPGCMPVSVPTRTCMYVACDACMHVQMRVGIYPHTHTYVRTHVPLVPPNTLYH